MLKGGIVARTTKQLAKQKGITQRHARRLAQQKKVSATKPGRDWVIGGTTTSGKSKRKKKGKK
jgi:uncharacterized protein YdbL (DUF1318 family)